ncbi:MAG: hypothetical protein ACT4ON_07525 [Bacteroidota bacterium]
MKKANYIIIGILSMVVKYCHTQNLVPNPSFEIFSSCPSANFINYANPWISPTAASPDYYNVCGASGFGIPSNTLGYQYPKDGVAYAGLYTFGTVNYNYREYIQVELIDSIMYPKIIENIYKLY